MKVAFALLQILFGIVLCSTAATEQADKGELALDKEVSDIMGDGSCIGPGCQPNNEETTSSVSNKAKQLDSNKDEESKIGSD